MQRTYRQRKYYCGEYLEVEIFPVYTKAKGRGKRKRPTSDTQKQLNQRHAEGKLCRLLHTKQQVYSILQSFDVLFDILDNADKKLLIKELIERIDLYPRESRKLSGQWIKTIYFKFPMYYNDSNEPTCTLSFDKNGNFLPKGKTDESIVCLEK